MKIFTKLPKGNIQLPILMAMLFTVLQLSAQNDCASATVIGSVPFSSGAQTTCGTVDDYVAGSYCTSSNYGGGEDYVYSINIASAPVTYNFALGGGATYKIMSVHSACPPTTGNCIGGLTTGSGTTASGSITFPSAGTFYIYIDTWPAPACGAFTLDITVPPPPPGNDDCGSATPLTVYATSCGGSTAGTTVNATQSIAAGTCGGTAEDDVWYSFTATEVSHIVTVVGASTLDAVVEGRSGACNGTQIGCADATAGGGTEVLTLTGLTIGSTYLVRIYGYGSGGSTQGTFTVCVTTPPSMSITTVATTQPASSVAQGASNVQILRFQVTTTGSLNPLSVTDINLDAATGTTNLADITNLKVYYTTLGTFSTTTQFGSTVAAPSATPTVTGSQVLATGSGNYFWIVYDISCSATPTNTIDCSLTSFVAGGTPNIPATPNPGSALAISALFAPTYASVGSASVAAGSGNNQIVRSNISGSALCPAGVTSVRFNTSTTTAPSTDILSAKCYYTTSTTFSTTTPFGAAVAAPSGDIIFTGSQTLASGSGNYFWLVYDISCGALPPNVITATAVDLVVGGNTIVITGTTPTAKTITALTSYDTKADGNWNDPNTWLCAVPPVGSTVPVNINHNVMLNTDATINASVTVAASKTLTINANTLNVGTATGAATQSLTVNGILSVGGGTVNVGTATAVTASNVSVASGGSLLFSSGIFNLGPTGGYNRTYTGSGTTSLTGGNMNVNGSISQSGPFTMSAGMLTIDGNGPSSPSGTIFAISASAANLNISGGTVLLVDPHPTGSSSFSFTGTGTYSCSGGKFVMGDGVSAATGSSTVGFLFSPASGALFRFYDFEVNGGAGTGRFAYNNWDFVISNTLEIKPSSELRMNDDLFVTKNLINDGMLTNNSSSYYVNFSGISATGTTPAATTNAISITGSGNYRNASSSPTANFYNLRFNTTNASIINIPSAMISGQGTGTVSLALELTAGKLDIGSTPFVLGISTSSLGTLSPSTPTAASYVIGEFRRWRSTSSGNQYFPVGTNVTPRFAQMNFTTGQTTGGIIGVKFFAAAPSGTSGLPYTDNGITIDFISPTGYWNIERISGAGGTYTTTVDASGFTKADGVTPISLLSDIRLIKRSTGGTWGAAGSEGTAATPALLTSVVRSACTTFSDFAIGGTALALPLELKSFTGKVLDHSNLLEWTTASEKNVAWHVVERSPNGFDNWEEAGRKASYGDAQVNQFYALEDRTPLAKSFYRLVSEDRDGKEQISDVIVLLRKNDQFGIVSVFPNPVSDLLQVRFNVKEESVVTARITDLAGRLIREQKTDTQKGINALSIDTGQLSAGTYIIQVMVGAEVSAPVRFVRQ